MQSHPYKLISFDADDTLWNFSHMMRCGLAAVERVAAEQLGPACAHLTTDFLLEAYRERAGEHDPTQFTWTELRRRMLADVLAEAGRADALELSYELIGVYLREWKANVQLFPGALELLDALRGRYPLAWVSNGNFGPEVGGMAAYFDIVLMPHLSGKKKPDPAVFHLAAAQAGCDTRDILHVGDSLTSDIGGAQAAGCTAVWFNPDGHANGSEHVPDATVTRLVDVLALLAG